MSQAFRHLDRRGVGKICVADALRAVRGEVSKRRAHVIDEAFDSLLFRLGGGSDAGDGQHSHTLEPVTVAKLYCAEAHPDVVSGVRTKTEVLSEFLEAFEGKQVFHQFLRGHRVSQTGSNGTWNVDVERFGNAHDFDCLFSVLRYAVFHGRRA